MQMGYLVDKIYENKDKNVADIYKENSMYFYEKYSSSSLEVMNIPLVKLNIGGFYFLHYMDDSNWMRYSLIFATSFRKFENKIIMTAVNLNFIPLEIRVAVFDKYISKKNAEENKLLEVDHKGMYDVLFKYGYEYSLVEYSMKQVVSAHFINMSVIDRFLYSGYPKNVYDPKKLYDIWVKKLKNKEKRHQEMMRAVISDFYDISKEIDSKYNLLKDHIDRVKKSYKKYG
jgi:hypothetical protein